MTGLTYRGTCRHHALLLYSRTDVGMVLSGQALLHELLDLFLVYRVKGHHVHPEVRALAGPRYLLEGHVRVGIFLTCKNTERVNPEAWNKKVHRWQAIKTPALIIEKLLSQATLQMLKSSINKPLVLTEMSVPRASVVKYLAGARHLISTVQRSRREKNREKSARKDSQTE